MNTPYILYSVSIFDGHLCSFQLGAIMNSAGLKFQFMPFGGQKHALLLHLYYNRGGMTGP